MYMDLNLKTFIVDVDGVLTDGKFYYSSEGKLMKKFGPHDSDGLKMLSEYIEIIFITADHRGFDITKKRIHDIGFEVELVSEQDRTEWINKNYNFNEISYMGDGYYDIESLIKSRIGISPNNALDETKEASDFVTTKSGGEGAVYEACKYLINLINENK